VKRSLADYKTDNVSCHWIAALMLRRWWGCRPSDRLRKGARCAADANDSRVSHGIWAFNRERTPVTVFVLLSNLSGQGLSFSFGVAFGSLGIVANQDTKPTPRDEVSPRSAVDPTALCSALCWFYHPSE